MTSGQPKLLSIAWLTARAIGYLFGILVAIFYLDVNLNPPGFTGRGLLALSIIPLASYRLARDCRSRIFFYLFGCLAAAPILALFFGGDIYVFSWSDGETAWRYIVASSGFLSIAGITSMYFAMKRWQNERAIHGFEVISKEPAENNQISQS